MSEDSSMGRVVFILLNREDSILFHCSCGNSLYASDSASCRQLLPQ